MTSLSESLKNAFDEQRRSLLDEDSTEDVRLLVYPVRDAFPGELEEAAGSAVAAAVLQGISDTSSEANSTH